MNAIHRPSCPFQGCLPFPAFRNCHRRHFSCLPLLLRPLRPYRVIVVVTLLSFPESPPFPFRSQLMLPASDSVSSVSIS
jgi:hypothetical protein